MFDGSWEFSWFIYLWKFTCEMFIEHHLYPTHWASTGDRQVSQTSLAFALGLLTFELGR